MTYLLELRVKTRLSRPDAARFFGVSLRTWSAWERGTRPPPVAVVLCLEFMTGDLRRFGFPGWTLHAGKLYNPANVGFTPGEIESLPWLQQLVAAYKRELRETTQRQQLTQSANDNVIEHIRTLVDD